jgi:hypothetical protein
MTSFENKSKRMKIEVQCHHENMKVAKHERREFLGKAAHRSDEGGGIGADTEAQLFGNKHLILRFHLGLRVLLWPYLQAAWICLSTLFVLFWLYLTSALEMS